MISFLFLFCFWETFLNELRLNPLRKVSRKLNTSNRVWCYCCFYAQKPELPLQEGCLPRPQHIAKHSTYVVRNLNRVRNLNILRDLNVVRDMNIKWQPLTAGFKAVSPFPALT